MPEKFPKTRKLAQAQIKQYPDRFKGLKPDDFLLMLDSIAQVETKNRNIKQDSGGPGRGYYQVEKETMPIAKKRYDYYREIMKKDSLPNISIPKNNDATKLSKDDQATLVLSNMNAAYANKRLKNPKAAPLTPLNSRDAWINYHWAGSEKDKQDRINHWNETFPDAKKQINMKKRSNYKPNEYGWGGVIGGVLGGAAGTLLFPGIGTAAGFSMGSTLGKGVEEIASNPQSPQNPMQQQMMQPQTPRDLNLYNTAYAKHGGRIRRNMYPNGGLINQVPGGNMFNMGNGIELANGDSHAKPNENPNNQNGMLYANNVEIDGGSDYPGQGGEVVLDGDFVGTNLPGSQPDEKQISISKRFMKNINNISDRNGSNIKVGQDFLKEKMKQDNQLYKEEKQAQAYKAYGKFIAKHGGYINKYTHGTGDEGIRPGPTTEGNGNYFDFNGARQFDDFSNVSLNYDLPIQDNSFGNINMNRIGNQGYNYNPQVQGYNTQSPWYNEKMKQLDTPAAGQSAESINQKSPFNYGQAAEIAGTLAPALYNLGRGIFDKSEKLNSRDYMNQEINPNLIPENTGQNEIRDAYSRGYYDLKNSGAYSKLGQTALMGSRAKNDYERKLQLASRNAEIGNQAGQFNANIRDSNIRRKLDINQMNAANRAQKRNFISQGVTDIGGAAGQMYQNSQMDKRQNEYFDIMDQVYGQTVPGYKSPRKTNTKGK